MAYLFFNPETIMRFEYGHRGVIVEVYDYLVVKSVLVPIFESSLHGSHSLDILQPVGLDVAHAKYISLVENQAANALIHNCTLYVT